MTRFIALIVAATSVGCVWLQGSSGPEGPTPVEQTSELLVLSGIRPGLSSWRDLTSNSVAAYLEGQSDEIKQDVEAEIGRLFSEERLEAEIVVYFVDHFDAGRVASVRRFFETDLGKRVRESAERMSDPELGEQLAAYLEELRANPVPRLRKELAHRLDSATRNTADLVEIQVDMSRILALAVIEGAESRAAADEAAATEEVSSESEEAPELTPEQQVARRVQLMRAQMTPLVRDQVLVATLFSQRDFPARDVVRHVQFAESPAARWYYGTLGNALRASMANGARELGVKIGALDIALASLAGETAGETAEEIEARVEGLADPETTTGDEEALPETESAVVPEVLAEPSTVAEPAPGAEPEPSADSPPVVEPQPEPVSEPEPDSGPQGS